MGPMNLDLDGLVGMRLNEHAFHTWDIEVVVNPAAVVPAEVAAHVVDNLELVARFTAKPTGRTRIIAARTIAPRPDFTISFAPSNVTVVAVTTGDSGREPDLELPAEACARLIYGRLDPQHTARTIAPRPDFTISFAPSNVTVVAVTTGDSGREPDLELPAEACARLIYGRLDPQHTPRYVATRTLWMSSAGLSRAPEPSGPFRTWRGPGGGHRRANPRRACRPLWFRPSGICQRLSQG
jgi:hypothetical protein